MLGFATQQFRSFWLPIFRSFVINCKELQIAQTTQIYQLFQLFEPNLYVRRFFLYWVACMLRSKDVNYNDISGVLQIKSLVMHEAIYQKRRVNVF